MSEFFQSPTIAQAEMRAINRSAVLEYLRLSKQASRTELAAQLKISKPTAMRIVDDLLSTNIVCTVGQREGGIGRNQELLSLNTCANLVIGIDLGGSHIGGGVLNIGGKVLFQSREEVTWNTPDGNFEIIAAYAKSLIQESARHAGKVLGMAIGVPGIVSNDYSTVVLSPGLNWVNYPLGERLQPLLPVPLMLENDVNLAALGEHWFGKGVGVNNLVFIAIGTGIGAGIILDGKLYRGHRNSSGEIGYLLPEVALLNNKYPGFGALESLASGKGIAERAARIRAAAKPGKQTESFTLASILESASQNEKWARDLFDETLDYLSQAIANVSVCFDPQMIILGGGVAQPLAPYVHRISERIKDVIPFVPQIAVSSLLHTAPLLGSVTRVFQKATEYVTVQTS